MRVIQEHTVDISISEPYHEANLQEKHGVKVVAQLYPLKSLAMAKCACTQAPHSTTV